MKRSTKSKGFAKRTNTTTPKKALAIIRSKLETNKQWKQLQHLIGHRYKVPSLFVSIYSTMDKPMICIKIDIDYTLKTLGTQTRVAWLHVEQKNTRFVTVATINKLVKDIPDTCLMESCKLAKIYSTKELMKICKHCKHRLRLPSGCSKAGVFFEYIKPEGKL